MFNMCIQEKKIVDFTAIGYSAMYMPVKFFVVLLTTKSFVFLFNIFSEVVSVTEKSKILKIFYYDGRFDSFNFLIFALYILKLSY